MLCRLEKLFKRGTKIIIRLIFELIIGLRHCLTGTKVFSNIKVLRLGLAFIELGAFRAHSQKE